MIFDNYEQKMVQQLRRGDLIFQLCVTDDSECRVFRPCAGYLGMALNHVALYFGDAQVVEVLSGKIEQNTLDVFFNRSVFDEGGRPCVMVARLKPEYHSLIDDAVGCAEQLLRLPYNQKYRSEPSAGKRGWRASELILVVFSEANHNEPVFGEMASASEWSETSEVFSDWDDFYTQAEESALEMNEGLSPALLSCSEKLDIVEIFGQLPVSQSLLIQLNREERFT